MTVTIFRNEKPTKQYYEIHSIEEKRVKTLETNKFTTSESSVIYLYHKHGIKELFLTKDECLKVDIEPTIMEE